MSKKHKPIDIECTGQIIARIIHNLSQFVESGDIELFLKAREEMARIRVKR